MGPCQYEAIFVGVWTPIQGDFGVQTPIQGSEGYGLRPDRHFTYNLLTSSIVVKVAGLYSVLFLSTRTRNFPSRVGSHR